MRTFTPFHAFHGQTPFSPAQLSPALWLSDTGSSAGTWPDISGNARDATQTDSTKQPSIVTNALNGKQVRRFDGSNDNLAFGGRSIFRNLAGASIFVVCKPTKTTVGESLIFQSATNVGNSRVYIACNVQATSWYYGGRRLDNNTGQFNSAGSFNGSLFYIANAVFNWGSAIRQFFINGSSVDLNTSFQTAGNTSDTDASVDGCIGALANSTLPFQGDIAEIIAFTTALSTANRQSVEKYLSYKYAIALS